MKKCWSIGLGLVVIAIAINLWRSGMDEDARASGPVMPNDSTRNDDYPAALEAARTNSATTTRRGNKRSGALEFPDGDIVQIVWRAPMRSSVHRYDVDSYAVLRNAALDGDAVASMMLHEMQRRCEDDYETDTELDAAIDQLYQTHTIPVPGTGQPARVSDSLELNNRAAVLRDSHAFCDRLRAAQGKLDAPWLERSARDGWPLAMVEFSRLQDDPASTRQWLEASWQAGSVQGLDDLFEIVQQTFDSGEDPSANVEAFAILHTYTLIETTLLDGQGQIAGRQADRLRAKLHDARQRLRPQQLEQALEQSKLMIRANSNCCYGF